MGWYIDQREKITNSNANFVFQLLTSLINLTEKNKDNRQKLLNTKIHLEKGEDDSRIDSL